MILDSKLTFASHIKHLRKTCGLKLNLLKVLTNSSWGADTGAMLKIYKCIIRSKLDYGCVVSGSTRKSGPKYLDTIHNSGIRIATGAFRTSPIKSLNVLYHEPTLAQRRNKLTLRYYFHIKSHHTHPMFSHVSTPFYERLFSNRPSAIPTFGLRVRKLLSDLNLEDFSILPAYELRPPWEAISFQTIDIFNNLTKAQTDANIYLQTFNAHREQYTDFNSIFTDGSKSHDHVASAAVIPISTISEKLHSQCSVFTSECHAIYLALQYISSQSIKKWLIYSDSKSCFVALQNKEINSHSIVNNILNLYTTLLLKEYEIIFCLVPGHAGISGNETADYVAKSTNNITNNPLTYTDIKNAIDNKQYLHWQNDWENEISNKLHDIKPSIESYKSLNLSRKQEVILNRLRIGHSRITH
ncbi:uncharacterized protein [Parasteatoda tepidariorum]|uniref:uncharacterized protein n=1 Tax=Parasteatoda tepidariorum TaxID=114398 RepID=UPI001C72970C|nr:uncharacterized protein LOC122270523 [Parasteatoda tepidariorum]